MLVPWPQPVDSVLPDSVKLVFYRTRAGKTESIGWAESTGSALSREPGAELMVSICQHTNSDRFQVICVPYK